MLNNYSLQLSGLKFEKIL